jgi:hypothetical protein
MLERLKASPEKFKSVFTAGFKYRRMRRKRDSLMYAEKNNLKHAKMLVEGK